MVGRANVGAFAKTPRPRQLISPVGLSEDSLDALAAHGSEGGLSVKRRSMLLWMDASRRRGFELESPLARGHLVSLALALCVSACGPGGESADLSENDPQAGDTSGSDAGREGDGGWEGGLPGEDEFETPECESGILCGLSASCCGAGEECVDEACAAACTTGVRCGDGCCGDADEVCLDGQCALPRGACVDSFDCEEDEFCEPTLSACLPQSGEPSCIVKGEVLPFQPALVWQWPDPIQGTAIFPEATDIISMPVVIDADQDGTPDVFVITTDASKGYSAANDMGYLRRLNGKTGEEVWGEGADVYEAANAVNVRGTAAAADLDGDGRIEIVAPKRGGGLIAFDAETGAFKWRSTMPNADDTGFENYDGRLEAVALAIADMDGDGKAEIIAGGLVFDHEGRLIERSMAGEKRSGLLERNDTWPREFWGGNANNGTYGAVSIVADVDGDPLTKEQYVITGKGAYRKDGSPLWEQPDLRDGYPAIADLDDPPDGIPELVVISDGRARVQNALTGELLAEYDFTLEDQTRSKNAGGPPTIADFDGDGVMDFASAGGYAYHVFEFKRDPLPVISLKWSAPTRDLSSNVTGSSVFDFEGDGRAEVVYADECFVRVYDGTHGLLPPGDPDAKALFEVPSSSGTIHEYPVLVDVTGNNRTEFLVVANQRNKNCDDIYNAMDPVPAYKSGLFVYGDANNKWVRTRRVWNQHSYHQTNIENDGRIPSPEPSSWAKGRNNDYRVSSQGKGVYNAPDLAVDLEISTAPCPQGVRLRARVKNQGSLGVPAGVPVEFFDAASPSSAAPFAIEATSFALLPGQTELVETLYQGQSTEFSVRVNGVGGGHGTIEECLEDNNEGRAKGECPQVR